MFIRNQVLKKLNGFDEKFFAHMEEIDLCWRAKNLMYDVKYVGKSEVYHVGGATLSNSNPKKTYLNFRNSLFTLTKNAKGHLFILIFTRLILDGVAAIKFMFEFKFKHILSILHAHFSFYLHLGVLLKQRKSLEKRQKYYNKTSIVLNYYVYKIRDFKRL
jgi:GT2 family glycosyltransferase